MRSMPKCYFDTGDLASIDAATAISTISGRSKDPDQVGR